MGILRKLAELVVEFPEDKAAPAAGSQRDVLASIEEVRGQIEAETAHHRATMEKTVTDESAPAGKPVKPTLPPRPGDRREDRRDDRGDRRDDRRDRRG